jgi:hypothetical protein
MGIDAPNYQYPEDIPHVSGDRGTAALVVRKDTGATLADVDGDYTLLQVDATGNLRVLDDYNSFEAQHVTLVPSTDTTITFAQPVRNIHIKNWDTSNRILVKDGAIASDSDATASRVGKSPTTDVPGADWFPFATLTIHLRSSSGSEVTVEGYF